MNHLLAYKQKVKSVIEKHGGKVDIDFIAGIHEQPTELKPVNFPNKWGFSPAVLNFTGVDVTIITSGVQLTLDEAKEYLKHLQSAINILEEIETE